MINLDHPRPPLISQKSQSPEAAEGKSPDAFRKRAGWINFVVIKTSQNYSVYIYTERNNIIHILYYITILRCVHIIYLYYVICVSVI